MRIVGGTLRGRTLASPEHQGVRPTSDRVREAVFNILAHASDYPPLDGARVIDLFAGTGALGIEAISRGARNCLFVETDAQSRALIRRNIETFGLTGVTRLFRRDATDLGDAGTMDAFDIAFLDPPYGKGLGERALAALANGGWLVPGALAVLEERAGTGLTLPAGYEDMDRRTWGDTDVHFLLWRGSTQAGNA
ncbi:MAG: 16S rRNA (guanine(966)-N(2))-methyltransferase RsmD [Hyphomicrobiaceae bacterium]|nr:16S rRNA (guanine(966)-N(2))-methyltransferase RsmD [Hyphomicrobiaceae bacterium]MCC0008634.1 16S rRNA (guanine(966)-N(2))-methyltransferase RsmD [Hyphomicrobiaceae bacterium]